MFSVISMMGNRQTNLNPCRPDYCRSKGDNAEIQAHLSEAEYLPMPRSMRKALLEGRRLQHVLPSRAVIRECKGIIRRERSGCENNVSLQVKEDNSGRDTKENKENIVAEQDEKDNSNAVEDRLPKNHYDLHVKIVDPVVQMAAVSREAMSLGDTNTSVQTESIPSPRLLNSPRLTNRRFSLIDMKTGLTKSTFTLELEDRLRQSKLDLGFDTYLTEWREFSYKMNGTGHGNDTHSLAKSKSNSTNKENVNRNDLINLCSKEATQYCAQSCQVSSPCRVQNPEVFTEYHSIEPSIFKEELNQKYDMRNLTQGKDKHPDKDNCDCDLCTLAYLTDMGFPEETEEIEETRWPTVTVIGGGSNERIRIIDNDIHQRSIEISVAKKDSQLNQKSSQSNVSTSESSWADCTNKKIRRLFNQYNRQTGLQEIYNNANVNVNDVSQIGPLVPSDDDNTKYEVKVRFVDSEQSQMNGSLKSPSTLSASVSSSLSTILSYRRVRQMFQTIIEKNRPRRKTRKNIYKFKEMEDLGLGKLKNNRWYPSNRKTVTIWNNMHSTAQGVQAEFKKYPKSHVRS